MRRLAIALAIVACSKSETKPPPAKTQRTIEAAPKQPVPTKPLPTLSADPGGLTLGKDSSARIQIRVTGLFGRAP